MKARGDRRPSFPPSSSLPGRAFCLYTAPSRQGNNIIHEVDGQGFADSVCCLRVCVEPLRTLLKSWGQQQGNHPRMIESYKTASWGRAV